MDIQRVESVAVPTVLAGVVGGATGYISKKAFDKDGKITSTLRQDMADSFTKNRKNILKEADSLDTLVAQDLNDIKGIIVKGLEKDNAILARAYKEAKTPEEISQVLRAAKENNIDVSKYINEAIIENSQKRNKLFKFVKKNFELLGLKTAPKQSKNDAVALYLFDHDAMDVKADFNKAIEREKLEAFQPGRYINNLFNKVYDKKAKGFKNDEASKEIVKSFKAAAVNMKLKQAGKFAGVASSIALAASLFSSSINNFYRNR